MEPVSVYDAKTHLSRLLDAVEAGEEVVITRNGRPMRLLLDTHAALWAVSEPDALSATARNAILGAEEIRLSVVSPWELVIKSALGKLVLHRTVEDTEIRSTACSSRRRGWKD